MKAKCIVFMVGTKSLSAESPSWAADQVGEQFLALYGNRTPTVVYTSNNNGLHSKRKKANPLPSISIIYNPSYIHFCTCTSL